MHMFILLWKLHVDLNYFVLAIPNPLASSILVLNLVGYPMMTALRLQPVLPPRVF